MNTATLNNLKTLRLSGVINSLELRIEEAIKNKLSYLEFFELVIQDEVINRTNRSNQNRLLKAKFKQHKTVEEFNFSYQPSINRQEIYALATCEFVRKKENIAFIGPPGTGNYEKILLMERNELTANSGSSCGFISFHNTSK